jgi:uncharacterized protein YuzE
MNRVKETREEDNRLIDLSMDGIILKIDFKKDDLIVTVGQILDPFKQSN